MTADEQGNASLYHRRSTQRTVVGEWRENVPFLPLAIEPGQQPGGDGIPLEGTNLVAGRGVTVSMSILLAAVMALMIGFSIAVLAIPPVEVGLDWSEAPAVLEGGGNFYANKRDLVEGKSTPPLQMARDANYKWIRQRVMVHPNGRYGLTQDTHNVLQAAKDIQEQGGLRFLLDFHYSHWWSDPGAQYPPIVWRTPATETTYYTMSTQDCVQSIYNYTWTVMKMLQDQGTIPDAVQIGNEVTNGMLWEAGRLPHHWENFVEMINSGIRAVKDVARLQGQNTAIPKIVIHLDQGGNKELCDWWFTTFIKYGGGRDVDVIGLSYYPHWHGSLEDLRQNINNLHDKFRKQVWVVETAYYYKGDDPTTKLPYPPTPQGQTAFLGQLKWMLQWRTSCRVVFYWGSHWSQPKTWFRTDDNDHDSWEDPVRRALFDAQGVALPAFFAWAAPWWRK